jgi:hypothetical protein
MSEISRGGWIEIERLTRQWRKDHLSGFAEDGGKRWRMITVIEVFGFETLWRMIHLCRFEKDKARWSIRHSKRERV